MSYSGSGKMVSQRMGFNRVGHADCLVAAFDSALDMLGQTSKQALLFHLKMRYEISFDDANTFSIEKLFAVLTSFLGNGSANIIMEKVLQEMDRVSNAT
jgi:hypothetical protein